MATIQNIFTGLCHILFYNPLEIIDIDFFSCLHYIKK